jgi:cytochrome c553
MKTTDTCFECGKPASHQHHVVPRSRSGENTVWLCVSCHGKAHERSMSGPDLTRLGIMKKDSAELCMIFHHLCDGFTMDDIADIYVELDMPTVRDRAAYIKRKVKRMKAVAVTDLLDLFEPVLGYDSPHYDREFYQGAWAGV